MCNLKGAVFAAILVLSFRCMVVLSQCNCSCSEMNTTILTTSTGSKLPVAVRCLIKPSLEELADALQKGLVANFATVNVSVVDSPDFRDWPFQLTSRGIGGCPRLMNVGAHTSILPFPNVNKLYDLDELVELVGLPGAFVLGAGDVYFPAFGGFGQMFTDVMTPSEEYPDGINGSIGYEVHHNETTPCTMKLRPTNNRKFAFYMSAFLSEGKASEVLRIHVKDKTGPHLFEEAVRTALAATYGNQTVALGGVFLVLDGTLNTLGIQHENWTTPITSSADYDKVICYFNVSAPLVCTSFMLSVNLDMNVESVQHAHCVSPDKKYGGHFNNDTVTPAKMEYLAYLVPAGNVYKVDGTGQQSTDNPLD